MFSDHGGTKLQISNVKISGNSPNIWKLNNTLVNIPWIKGMLKRKIRKYLEWKQKHNISKFVDDTKVRIKEKLTDLNVYIREKKINQWSQLLI